MPITLPILEARVVERAAPTSARIQVLVNGDPPPPMWIVEVDRIAVAICDTEREAQAVLAALELDKLLERIGRRLVMKAV